MRDIPQGTWLLLADERGEAFTHQAGGYACHHPEMIGQLRSLPDAVSAEFMDYFCGSKHGGWCDRGIDEADAVWLDERLASHGITVDRARLQDSMEAWVYVKHKDGDGVLAWENSD